MQANNQVGFEVPSYGHTRPLVVDPVLTYSTYLGGSSGEIAYAIAVDASGSAYVTGFTFSSDFPTTPGAFRTSSLGGGVFVTKLDPTGSALVYSTYLGGSGQADIGYAIAVDASGNAYVAGISSLGDFPTVNPVQATSHGPQNAFLAKLNAAGSALIYSTYLGGSSYDWANAIAVDPSGNAYVTGNAKSTDFPTVNSLQATNHGNGNAFVAKLSAAGSALVYSTYLGGSTFEESKAIAADASGNAYVAGYTASADFPRVNAFQATKKGDENAFVSKLNAAGSALAYSTYLGGSLVDSATGITVDASGNAYVTGYTSSTDFPTLNPTLTGGSQCIFTVTFTPQAPGVRTANLAFTDNAASGTQTIVLTGGVQTPVGLSTTILNFPPDTQPVTITNNTAQTVVLTSIQTDDKVGAQTIVYTWSSDCYILAAGASCVVNVTYHPDRGVENDFLNIRGSSVQLTVALNVTGPTRVTVSPASLSFASQAVGTTSSPQSVTLTNNSSATLSITSFAPSGDYAITNNTCGGAVLGGTSCTFGVTFTPTAAGTRSGAITINDNAASTPQTVSLTGTGGPPALV